MTVQWIEGRWPKDGNVKWYFTRGKWRFQLVEADRHRFQCDIRYDHMLVARSDAWGKPMEGAISDGKHRCLEFAEQFIEETKRDFGG